LHGLRNSPVFPYTTLFRSVPVWSREMSATELRLEVGEQRDHRSFDFVFVLVSVRIEICLRVVRAQPAKEALEVATPTGKLASHRDRKSTRLNSSHVAISYA